MRIIAKTRAATSRAYVERVNLAIDYVVSGLGQPLRLAEVSRAAMLSPFHFHRVFQTMVGVTLTEFVKRLRLEKALSMMAFSPAHSRRDTLTTIGLKCRFSSSSDFSRCFKQRFGVAPSVFDIKSWRDAHRSELETMVPGSVERLHLKRTGGMVHACVAMPCPGTEVTIRNTVIVQHEKTRKTCRRYNDPGHAHALTFSCFRRQSFLTRDHVRQWLIDAIELARRRHELDLWAYVIMPEHVHVLIYPRAAEYSISRILGTLKQPVSKRAILFVQRKAPAFLPWITDAQPNGKTELRFWQRGGGYDRNLWSPKHIWETIDYIHANPVRRGLCAVDTDWPWSSARAYAGSSIVPITIDFDSLPNDPRRINALQ